MWDSFGTGPNVRNGTNQCREAMSRGNGATRGAERTCEVWLVEPPKPKVIKVGAPSCASQQGGRFGSSSTNKSPEPASLECGGSAAAFAPHTSPPITNSGDGHSPPLPFFCRHPEQRSDEGPLFALKPHQSIQNPRNDRIEMLRWESRASTKPPTLLRNAGWGTHLYNFSFLRAHPARPNAAAELNDSRNCFFR
jgi:hypothetical protein